MEYVVVMCIQQLYLFIILIANFVNCTTDCSVEEYLRSEQP